MIKSFLLGCYKLSSDRLPTPHITGWSIVDNWETYEEWATEQPPERAILNIADLIPPPTEITFRKQMELMQLLDLGVISAKQLCEILGFEDCRLC